MMRSRSTDVLKKDMAEGKRFAGCSNGISSQIEIRRLRIE
jgi:hypothetical protein